MFVKLFASILDSSIWLEDVDTRLLWITMLAMADEEGLVAASVGGLAARARITREACEAGLAILLAPDPDSRSEEYEGRRIEKVHGGWLILNHGVYREIRTKHQRTEAARQRRHRAKKAELATDTVTGVTDRDSHEESRVSHNITPNASVSLSVSKREGEDQELVGREETVETAERPRVPDPLVAVLKEARFPLERFEFNDGKLICAFLRGQRSPLAVALTLRAHLLDEEVEPHALALAVQEYMGKRGNDQGFESRYFAGFVRRAVGHVKGKPMRQAARQEERFIETEDVAAERARREEADADALLTDFERRNEGRYGELAARAEAMVDAKIAGKFRAPMVRSALATLVRQWIADNEGGARAAR